MPYSREEIESYIRIQQTQVDYWRAKLKEYDNEQTSIRECLDRR